MRTTCRAALESRRKVRGDVVLEPEYAVLDQGERQRCDAMTAAASELHPSPCNGVLVPGMRR